MICPRKMSERRRVRLISEVVNAQILTIAEKLLLKMIPTNMDNHTEGRKSVDT